MLQNLEKKETPVANLFLKSRKTTRNTLSFNKNKILIISICFNPE